jgi:hypothetical protein
MCIEGVDFSDQQLCAAQPHNPPGKRMDIGAQSGREQPSELTQYRAALAAMDWQFEFSDEHARWAAGTNALARLHRLQRELDPSGDIWMQTPGAHGHGAPSPNIAQVAQ